MVTLPDDLPVIERRAVRVVVCDAEGRILLFHTRDVGDASQGFWWELPGGGMDDGESIEQTALRELAEETGIIAAASQVGPPIWRRTATFRYRGGRRLQHESVVRVQLDVRGEAISEAARLDYELEDYMDFRWWPVAEVIASRERFYPGRLPQVLAAFLAGEAIDEPFELWS